MWKGFTTCFSGVFIFLEQIDLFFFVQDELQAAIDNLKKSKASDNNGIRAEDIKTCDETTKETIRQIFHETRGLHTRNM